MTCEGVVLAGGSSLRSPLLVIALAAFVLAPSVADADPSPATGLLWKHRHDGSLNGWTALGDAWIDVVYGPEETLIATFDPWPVDDSVRSPSFPVGTRRVVLDVVPESAWDDMVLTARGAAGNALLAIATSNTQVCVVGAACSPREYLPDHVELDIRIEPSGWSVRHDDILVAAGATDLGALDHVTFRGSVPGIRDARAYGAGGHVDAALRTALGGFAPYVERLDGHLLPLEDKAYSFSSFGLVVQGRDTLRERTLIRADLEPGAWAFQTLARPNDPAFNGYALLAGLDAQGRTLWSVEVDRDSLRSEPATLHFRDGSQSTHLMDLSTPISGWSAWIAAHGDPQTGLLSLRVRNVALDPIAVPTLSQTTALAFGDATALAPGTAGSATGAGRAIHLASFVARVPDGFEV